MSGEVSAVAEPTMKRAVLDRVKTYLARELELKRWWDSGGADRPPAQKFTLTRTFNRPDVSFGFFGETPVEGRPLPIMGNFQGMFYDQPKSPRGDVRTAEWMRDQMRQFILGYFMRISSFATPQNFTDPGRGPTPLLLRPFSWCPDEAVQRQGFGFSQLYYKLQASGEAGCFPPAERAAIVDLREIGTKYAWVVLLVRIFDFTVSFSPFGAAGPRLVVPLWEDSLLVMSPELVLHREDPEPGVLGSYGFGYAFIKNPVPGLLAYGPGEFDAAVETIYFHVLAGGEVRLDMTFIANRPQRILNVPLNPLALGLETADAMSLGLFSQLLPGVRGSSSPLLGGGGVDPLFASISLANLLTGGLAAERLCISRSQLEKDFLVTHFVQHYTMATGSLLT